MRDTGLMRNAVVVRFTFVRDCCLMGGKMYRYRVMLNNVVVAKDNLVDNNSLMVLLS